MLSSCREIKFQIIGNVGRGLLRRRDTTNLSLEGNTICGSLKMSEQVCSVSAPNIVETSFRVGFPAESFGDKHFLGRDASMDFDAIRTNDNIHCALCNRMCHCGECGKLQHGKKVTEMLDHQRRP